MTLACRTDRVELSEAAQGHCEASIDPVRCDAGDAGAASAYEPLAPREPLAEVGVRPVVVREVVALVGRGSLLDIMA